MIGILISFVLPPRRTRSQKIGFLNKKIKAVTSFSSQFHDENSKDKSTPISSLNFLESVSYRAKNFGRLIGTKAGEGFTSKQPLSIGAVNDLIR